MSVILDEGIAVLERTPAVFRALLAGLPESWLGVNEGPNTFSPFDNIGHIGQTVRVMAKRYREEVGPWRQDLPIMDR